MYIYIQYGFIGLKAAIGFLSGGRFVFKISNKTTVLLDII